MASLIDADVKFGDKGPVVRALQVGLTAAGFSPGQIDGDFGPRTAQAVRAFKRSRGVSRSGKRIGGHLLAELLEAPAPSRPELCAPAPRVCAWIDRKGVLEPGAWADEAARLDLDRVGLFVGPHPRTTRWRWRSFVSARRMAEVVRIYRDHGIGVDLLCWIAARKAWVDAMLAYTLPVLDDGDTRLDLDSEGAFRRRHLYSHATIADHLFERLPHGVVDEHRLSVNDYASLQGVTRHLLRPGVRRRPQAYSVSYVTHGKVGKDGRRWTKPGDIYFPGVTQRFALAKGRWGGTLDGSPLDIGLAAYKPFPGRSIDWQIQTQVAAAMEYGPAELWFWQLRMAAGYRDAIASLAQGRAAA